MKVYEDRGGIPVLIGECALSLPGGMLRFRTPFGSTWCEWEVGIVSDGEKSEFVIKVSQYADPTLLPRMLPGWMSAEHTVSGFWHRVEADGRRITGSEYDLRRG
jgi:hypothetical protein